MVRKLNELRYIQLDAAKFLSDPDYQAGDAEWRGVFVHLIFTLACNGGKMRFDEEQLKLICRAQNWEETWRKVKRKFQIRGEQISHKKVFYELKKSMKMLQDKKRAGLASGRSRRRESVFVQSSVRTENEQCSVRKDKVSKDKNIPPAPLTEAEKLARIFCDTMHPSVAWEHCVKAFSDLIDPGKYNRDPAGVREVMGNLAVLGELPKMPYDAAKKIREQDNCWERTK